MENELVSVIIPTYNRYTELLRAIDSVINQTYKNIEIIVVDDNFCNIELRNKIKNKLHSNYEFVSVYFKNKKMYGYGARNLGIKNANGIYLSFLDDDDEYYPTKIEEQINLFKKKNDDKLALVYSYGKIIYPNGQIEDERTNYSGAVLKIQMQFNIAGTSFWLVKKEALLKIGAFKKIHSHQDGIVLLDLLAYGYTIDLVKKDLVIYHFHKKGAGITDVNENTINADKEYFNRCKSYFDLIDKRDRKKVILKYYNDRNWNLIIIKKYNLVWDDIFYLVKQYFFTKTLFICIYRYIFRHKIIKKENEFDRFVLLKGDENE